MGDVVDLAAYRDRREGPDGPGRRHGRQYRYDPGPLEGKSPRPDDRTADIVDDDHKSPA